MAILLHLETATEVCSVCISENEQILAREESAQQYTHASEITLLIEACLEKVRLKLRDVDAVSVSKGPGSYTGLRIGSATAKGICYALDLPLIAVDTLRALGLAMMHQVKNSDAYYCPMIDARRMEVYASLYDSTNQPILHPQSLIIEESTFSEYFSQGKRIVFAGNGSEKCRLLIRHELAVFHDLKCSSTHLVPLAFEAWQAENFESLAYFEPFYLKAPNITKSKKNL